MRRVLNLNQPAIVFVKLIALFILVIPVVLYGAHLLLDWAKIQSEPILTAIMVSFGVGACLFVILLVLIIAEQIQDAAIEARYQKDRERKLERADGNYECQYCGNQKVKAYDNTCQVCGKELK